MSSSPDAHTEAPVHVAHTEAPVHVATGDAPTDAPRHVDGRHVDGRHVAPPGEPSAELSADHSAKPAEQMSQTPSPQAVSPQTLSPRPQAATPQQAVSPQTVADLRSLVLQYEQSLSDEADSEVERALAGVGDALRAYEEAGKRAASGDERVA